MNEEIVELNIGGTWTRIQVGSLQYKGLPTALGVYLKDGIEYKEILGETTSRVWVPLKCLWGIRYHA